MQCQWISEIKNNNTPFNTNTGVAKISQWGGGGGTKRLSEGRVWDGVSSSHGREIFDISCIKVAFLHIKRHY